MRTIPVTIAAAVVNSATALAEPPKPVDFGGEWWSIRCARIVLSETGSRLTGHYVPSGGKSAGQQLELTGFRSGIDLLGFAVNFGPDGPIATWAGQHTIEGGIEKIIAQWHMATDVPDEDEERELYRSIWAGADSFVCNRPNHCR
jgi:hypothetical protein